MRERGDMTYESGKDGKEDEVLTQLHVFDLSHVHCVPYHNLFTIQYIVYIKN